MFDHQMSLKIQQQKIEIPLRKIWRVKILLKEAIFD